ncbi:MAG: hypothetical protein M1822_000205 [Bathelium mastoideum]|nr:MAG: hypothetical protein M1822_000205 [Bathelium mastoideum]
MQAFAAERATSAHRKAIDPNIPECRYSYINPPVGLSEPSPRRRSKLRQRTQRDVSRKDNETRQRDRETDSSSLTYSRLPRDGISTATTPNSSSLTSHASSHSRHKSSCVDDLDDLSMRAQPSSATISSNHDHDHHHHHHQHHHHHRHRLPSPQRGRTREAVQLRSILRTPSQSRYPSSPSRDRSRATERHHRRDSSSRGPRVTFALRNYSPDAAAAAVPPATMRRDSIRDVRPVSGASRVEEERGQAQLRWWPTDLDGEAAAAAVRGTRDADATTSRDGFSDSGKTVHPKAFDRRRGWREDDVSNDVDARMSGALRGDSSSGGDESMDEWRSRARQRSLKRGEKLRADHRVEVRKARPAAGIDDKLVE